MRDDGVTRAELEAFGAELTLAIFQVLVGAPAGAFRKGNGARDDGLPADFRTAVRDALRHPLVTYADVGFRAGDDVHDVPLAKALGAESEDDERDVLGHEAGPTLRAIRAARRKRGRS